MHSFYIFNDGLIKGKLIRKDKDWFVGEWKEVADQEAKWFPWIAGTTSWLQLSDQDIKWAKNA